MLDATRLFSHYHAFEPTCQNSTLKQHLVFSRVHLKDQISHCFKSPHFAQKLIGFLLLIWLLDKNWTFKIV